VYTLYGIVGMCLCISILCQLRIKIAATNGSSGYEISYVISLQLGYLLFRFSFFRFYSVLLRVYVNSCIIVH